jgi:hypothetical protein
MADISRRTLLGGAAALAAGAALGATSTVHHKIAVPPTAPPESLVIALASQQRLLGGYDAVLRTLPDQQVLLVALRTDITAHGNALRSVLEQYPGWRYARNLPSANPTVQDHSKALPSHTVPSNQARQPSSAAPIAATVRALAAASKEGAALAAAACLGWADGEAHGPQVVPLLGSIAACLSSHAELLT